MPATEKIVGAYTEKSRTLDHTFDGPKASLVLHADGTMRVRNLPYEQTDQRHCRISGDGYWSGASEQGHLDLHVIDAEGVDACPVGAYSSFAVAGKREPYALYWVVSDPDAGMGVWLASNR